MKGISPQKLHIAKSELFIRILIPLLYLVFYAVTFRYLETRSVTGYKVIKMEIDSHIPFIEYFIVPYMLWFGYIAVTVVTFIFLDRKDYIRLMLFLGIGMTIFLLLSYLVPNMQPLRPYALLHEDGFFPRDNIFVDMVRSLYQNDTSTNVFPSIHAFNSIAVAIAIHKAEKLSKIKGLPVAADILSLLIVLSTLFLKQHSMFDVLTAIVMAVILYIPIYYLPEAKAARTGEKNQRKVMERMHP